MKNVAVPGLENGMDYVKLGDSDLEVSKVCMGTMTFGEVSFLSFKKEYGFVCYVVISVPLIMFRTLTIQFRSKIQWMKVLNSLI